MTDTYNPNYVNPQYATPEQLKQIREYSAQLLKGSTEPNAKSWAGVAGNFIQGLTGQVQANRANDIQQQALQNLAGQTSQLVQQGPGGYAPALIGSGSVNPMASPEHQALIRSLGTPSPVQDVYGRPGYATPAQGVRPSPVQQDFTPGYRGETSVSSEGVKTPTAFPAPMPSFGGAPQQQPQGPSLGGIVKQAIPAINDLAANASANKANTEFIGQIGQRATDSTNVIKYARTISDLINANKGKVTWGPGAELSQDIKKGIVNFAPGLGSVFSGPVAATDAIQKMTSSLAPVLARQIGGGTGSDAQLANGLMAVPSLHNSEAGALALSDMIEQSAQKDIAAHQFAMSDPPNARARYQQYMNDHPIRNPLTGNDIRLDIAQEQARKKFEDKNQGGTANRPASSSGWGIVR